MTFYTKIHSILAELKQNWVETIKTCNSKVDFDNCSLVLVKITMSMRDIKENDSDLVIMEKIAAQSKMIASLVDKYLKIQA
jgi:hypothetical protein